MEERLRQRCKTREGRGLAGVLLVGVVGVVAALGTRQVSCRGDVQDELAWAFLNKYPAQYTTRRLHEGEIVQIDGKLDERSWKEAPWTSRPFVDIAQSSYPNIQVPDKFQTRVKVLWDANYLYVAAELFDQLIWADIEGHNERLTDGHAPYWNDDFEIFIDAFGSTHSYKEMEFNLRNASYDVLWNVPDKGMSSRGVPCYDNSNNDNSKQSAAPPAPATSTANAASMYSKYACQNTTFNGGTWTMVGGTTGMVSATSFRNSRDDVYGSAYTPFTFDDRPTSWIIELRLPIRKGEGHGGLLDTATSNSKMDGYEEDTDVLLAGDPLRSTRWWWIDFARAEHPLLMVPGINRDFTSPDYDNMCQEVQRQWPTLLGSDAWSCYFEWVWQQIGPQRYMHNPEKWGYLHLVDDAGDALKKIEEEQEDDNCKHPEWPIRFVLASVYYAQVAHMLTRGTYTDDIDAILEACGNSDAAQGSCDAPSLALALHHFTSVFTLHVLFDSGSECVNYKTDTPTGGACFEARVNFTHPSSNYACDGSIRTDRYMQVTCTDNMPPCLFSETPFAHRHHS